MPTDLDLTRWLDALDQRAHGFGRPVTHEEVRALIRELRAALAAADDDAHLD